MSGAPIQPGRAPSVTLPLAYMVAAAVALALAAASLPWLAGALASHYYQPRVLALTHVVALGWITLAIMGASYQFIPVVLERPLWSERLARWQLAWLVAGLVGMIGHFMIGRWAGLLWAAAMVGLGVLSHLANVLVTVHGVARWDFTGRLVAGAHVGLGLTVVFGLVLGSARVFSFAVGDGFSALHAHFHLALLGWIVPMMVGVGARVYPMFLLAEEPRGTLGHVQSAGLALGVPATVAGLLGWPALLLPGALAVAAALGAHSAWIVGMVRRRKRPALDWGLRFVLTGALFLPPAAALGVGFAAGWLGGPRAALAYAVLALGGWVSLTIAGMMLKIVPFLVWYRAYGAVVGRRPVPTLAQLSWPAAERLAYGLLTAGVTALAAATWAGEIAWIRLAGVAVALGALAFAATVARVLAHLGAARRASDARAEAGVR